MTDTTSPAPDLDALLTAWLDGELSPAERAALDRRMAADPAIRARLETLRAGSVPAAPFDLLLADAPTRDLMAGLADAKATAAGAAPVSARRGSAVWMGAAAAAIVFLAVGCGVGYGVAQWMAPPPVVAERPNWRTVVAEYLSLYTSETLALIPDDEADRSRELADIASKLSLTLTPEAVSFPDLTLKRAQLFEFRGMPLGQIAYLSSKDGPVAFCIIANGRPDAPPAFEQRDGMNIVFWTKGGHGYLVIGKVPRETLEAMAASLDGRIS